MLQAGLAEGLRVEAPLPLQGRIGAVKESCSSSSSSKGGVGGQQQQQLQQAASSPLQQLGKGFSGEACLGAAVGQVGTKGGRTEPAHQEVSLLPVRAH